MINSSQLSFFSSEDLIIYYFGLYNQEYGNIKGLEILSKIQTSKKVREFITKLRIEELSPGNKGFITLVNSIPYFLFSKGETLGYGTLYAIQLWIAQTSNDSFQLTSDRIHEIIVETIYSAENTKTHISGNISFFHKYFGLLENLLNNSNNNSTEQGYSDLIAF